MLEETFHPELTTHRIRLNLDLRDRMAKFKVFLVSMAQFDRRLVFSPKLPSLWFEVLPNEDLTVRANEVYEKYCRQQIKDQGSDFDPKFLATQQEAWVTSIDVDIHVEQLSRAESEKKFASLWSEEEMNGNTELNRVGRCLDHAYPDDLEHAVCREEHVERILQLLENPDQRPVVLIGPSLSGKTAIIHQVVRTRVELPKEQRKFKKSNIWLLAPQRIVSGMSFVGQWENRCLAIFKEAQKRKHILYFDDLLGLFRAGQSSSSNLCVGDLLKNAILNQRFQVLAEATPEAFDKLTELDRSFADLFYVHRIESTNTESTTRIALEVMRNQEFRQKTTFELNALPAILQLQRQYVRDGVFPGKAARFIQQIAVKRHHSRISRNDVLNEFSHSTGISFSIIDDQWKFDRDAAIVSLRTQIVGQDDAIDACVDVMSTAKARLNDPQKPLATLMFLGPTGVGKTECAKALARLMYSTEDNLIRFDLNEFKTPHSVARLVGTFDDPDGLLTRAVRQQPFAVVLFDEIEKAHPDVYDILLQVTGEGRLTDALGRTTDFSNAVLIMTSNLGTKSKRGVGFKEESSDEADHRFVQAARKFFRPEFFNRIDRLIPFSNLTREQIEMIAEQMMQGVVSREGLVRRRCVLQIHPACVRQVCDRGFQPELGARALKRAVERHFTQPVAAPFVLHSIRSSHIDSNRTEG